MDDEEFQQQIKRVLKALREYNKPLQDRKVSAELTLVKQMLTSDLTSEIRRRYGDDTLNRILLLVSFARTDTKRIEPTLLRILNDTKIKLD